MTLGEKLQRLRRARGMTQEQLAEKVGVSRQSLSGWENDTALPDTANVIALAELFGVTTDYLLREAPSAGEEAPSGVPPVLQLVQPKKKAPLPLLVLGGMLLALGLAAWIGFYIAQCAHPVELSINGTKYTGVQAFIRSRHMEAPYYAGIAAMVVGAFAVAFYYVLSWALNREQKHEDQDE